MGKRERRILESPQINIKCYANQSGKVCILRKSFLVWRHNWPASEDWAEWWWDNDDKERQREACDKCGLLRGAPVNGQPYHHHPTASPNQPLWYVLSGIWYFPSAQQYQPPGFWYTISGVWYLHHHTSWASPIQPVWLSGIFYVATEMLSLVIVSAPPCQLEFGCLCLVASVSYLSGMPSKRYI